MTTDDTSKKRRRQTPMEGFNTVPKMLEEARRLVDTMTEPEAPAGLPTAAADQPEAAPAPSRKSKPARTAQRKPAGSPSAPKGLGQTPAALPAAGPAPKPIAARSLLSPAAAGIQVRHRLPGRTRLKILRLQWNPALATILTTRLARVPGVLDVAASTITGSVVVSYHPRELCQPTARQALQEAWQELFPAVEPEKLTAALLWPD